METYMQRFHGTAARQLVLTESGAWSRGAQEPESTGQGPGFSVRGPMARVQGPPRLRLMQKDMYAGLARRRRRAQIAARRWTVDSRED